MNDASFCAALLQSPAITALVGNRASLGQLKQGAALPALVYQIITATDKAYLGGHAEPGLHTLRIQINPLALSVDAVEAIHAAVRAAVLQAAQADGVRIIRATTGGSGPYSKDDTSGAWTRAADYLVTLDY